MKLHGLSPNSYVHASVSDVLPEKKLRDLSLSERFIYSHDRSAYLLQNNIGGPIVGIYKSFTETEIAQFLFWEYKNRVFFAVHNKKCDLEDASRELNAVLNG
jgi:hypothetical protein